MDGTYFSRSAAEFDPMSTLSAEQIFEKGFGEDVQHEQVIYDPRAVKGLVPDVRKSIAKKLLGKTQIEKAGASIDAGLTGGLGTGGAGTAGSALIPVWVDTEVVDQTAFETPLRMLIRRIAVKGKTYDFNAITAKGGASWRGEDSSLPEDVDTYDRLSVNIKFGYSVGRLTNPAIAAMRGYVDASALDLSVKTAALFELEEDTIINGDASTYPTEFNGLIQSITTNTTNNAGAAITLAGVRSELAETYQAKGRTDLIVTDVHTHNYFKGLLMEFQRQPSTPAQNLPFGIPGAFEFDGVSVIRDQFMPTTAASRRMLFLDTRYLVMAVLLDVTFQEIPTLNDSRKYMLKVYEALAVKYEGAMSQIYGIQ